MGDREDFNFPLNLEDKFGGRVKLFKSMEYLRNFVNQNHLIDLPLKGINFT